MQTAKRKKKKLLGTEHSALRCAQPPNEIGSYTAQLTQKPTCGAARAPTGYFSGIFHENTIAERVESQTLVPDKQVEIQERKLKTPMLNTGGCGTFCTTGNFSKNPFTD